MSARSSVDRCRVGGLFTSTDRSPATPNPVVIVASILGAMVITLGSWMLVIPVFAQSIPNPVDATLQGPAGGQGLPPGEYRPPLPPPRLTDEEGQPLESLELPTLEVPTQPTPRLDAGLAVPVKRFVVRGNTVFSPEELAAVLAPWMGRRIESEELLAARDALTRLYVDHGYATSGAIIPDQDVEDGTVRLQVIEGRVSRIEVRGNVRFRDLYFEQRLELATRAPVSVNAVERALQIMQRDPWIERVDAMIEPGDRLGESRLIVVVTERPPWQLSAEVGNDSSPALGRVGGTFEGRFANLAGVGDVWSTRFEVTQGLIDVDARIEVPITPWDTRLQLRARITESRIEEHPFDSLDIESKSRSYGVSFLQPAYRSDADEVWLELMGEWRETKSTVMGQAFCFELVTRECDRPRVAALRLGVQWTHRTQRDVLAARSLFSFGLPILNATTGGPSSSPNGQFFAWLGQAQWAHVYSEELRGTQLVLRADAQIADDPLLSMEKIAVGGRQSVRGYRENQLVSDNAVVLSGEFRIPVLRNALRRPLVELVPFMDFARAWDHGSHSPAQNLWSIGTGLRVMLREGMLGEFYWGGRLDHVPNPNEYLQDYGISMRLRIDAPEIF